MPIYGYRCAACGHQKDVLQKISDAPLTDCPACGAAAFTKEVSAPAFQLKGTGWYVTDFRDGNQGAKKSDAAKGGEAGAGSSEANGKDASTSSDTKSSESKTPDAPKADSGGGGAKAAPAPAPAAKKD